MDEAEHGLHDLLLDRLVTDPDADDALADLVLAAWAGDEELAETLAGRPVAATDRRQSPPRPPQPDAYLAGVHVQGFRGIGAPATLPLRPGPGLTLVTGRNGSGKSSFAEAAELALTGDSGRWSGRTAVWREGWRNLHADGPTTVAVDLVEVGTHGTVRIERSWDKGAELTGGAWTRQRGNQKRTGFDGAEWRQDMRTYRPFLSYSELGALIDGKPSELHDALHNLLGLGPLGEAQVRIGAARKQLADAARSVDAARRDLRAELTGVDDQRVEQALSLLQPKVVDLPALAGLVAGANDQDDTTALTTLTTLPVPTHDAVTAATAAVRAALDRVHALSTTEARTAGEVAELLRVALHQHAERGTIPCPVCGSGFLDAGWRADAARRMASLEQASTDVRRAAADLDSAAGAARRLVAPAPAVLTSPPIDATALQRAWEQWIAAGDAAGPAELAHDLDRAHPDLADAVTEVRERAEKELAQRDTVWLPIARRLSTWHDDAARTAGQAATLAALQAAEKWLSRAALELRDERIAPLAAESQRVWQQLRQQSNVDLGPLRLDGVKTRRRVAMDVSVDGADGGTALGVMSQGELHALGLSLFLPRATAPQSPFRFVLIDDPVQAMDPAKVDGLARVLSEVATTRQVVVFTHDDRLADAVRRLELPATVWEVQRGERSAVAVRRSDDPVRRYLDDARAMAQTKELPADIRGELVASCCRSAVEAACHVRIRRTRLGRGDTHASVEEAIAEATTTHKKATMAVFDDPGRGADLLGRLRSIGPWAANALQICKKGAHQGFAGDLRPLVRDVEQLTDWLQK